MDITRLLKHLSVFVYLLVFRVLLFRRGSVSHAL